MIWMVLLVVVSSLSFAIDESPKNITYKTYKENTTDYELLVRADFEQNDKVEVSKSEPMVVLSRWNDESRTIIKPVINNVTPTKNSTSNRVEYESDSRKVFIEPVTDSEFDIDFIVYSKPSSNVFTYEILNTQDLDFFYQAPLWQDAGLTSPNATCNATTCITNNGGVWNRPENVVGSYAVYSKTKRDYNVGRTNYGTGKLFHIYRPKAIDAKNNTVWATLSYKNNDLTVTVPQNFLNTATYPIIIDPTFGYTSIGASTNPMSTARVRIFGFNATTEGVLTQIYFAAYGSGVNLKSGIYNGTSTTGDALLGMADLYTIPDATLNSWRAWGVNITIKVGFNFFAILNNQTTGVNYYDTGGIRRYTAIVAYNDDFPNPWNEVGGGSDTQKTSIYATIHDVITDVEIVEKTFESNNSWVAPDELIVDYGVIVEAWGGGGKGGTRITNGAGGGGGGGAYSRSNLTLTPGNNYTITVGVGATVNSTNGGNTWFMNTTTVLATGGNTVVNENNQSGSGGSLSLGFGDVKYSGGSGGGGLGTTNGGGGGGGAGSTANGTTVSGTSSTGGVAVFELGGVGGNGRTSTQGNGLAGSHYGGGGGGGLRTSSSTRSGGNGGNGFVRITYYLNTSITPPTGNDSCTYGGSGDWWINHNCNITSNVDLLGNSVVFNGSVGMKLTAVLNNVKSVRITPNVVTRYIHLIGGSIRVTG